MQAAVIEQVMRVSWVMTEGVLASHIWGGVCWGGWYACRLIPFFTGLCLFLAHREPALLREMAGESLGRWFRV
jgi:hypothetical protein